MKCGVCKARIKLMDAQWVGEVATCGDTCNDVVLGEARKTVEAPTILDFERYTALKAHRHNTATARYWAKAA